MLLLYCIISAEVAEWADALDSKSSGLNTRAGSTPAFGTILYIPTEISSGSCEKSTLKIRPGINRVLYIKAETDAAIFIKNIRNKRAGGILMNHKTNYKKLLEIFISFFKIGSFTFGGGFAMIPLIGKEVTEKKGWVKEEEIIDIFAVSQSIPGAVAINSATLIGYKMEGRKGAYSAILGVILPSFLIILIIAAFFSKFQDNPIVQAAFKGVRPTVVALISTAAVKIGKAAIKDNLCVIITVIAFILVMIFDVHAIFTIIGGAAVGLIVYKFFPHNINVENGGLK